MKKLVVVVAAMLTPLAGIAQESSGYLCTNGIQQRRVEVARDPGVTVPCEVHYYKDTEAPGERQVLWRAMREEGYCEAQVEAFVEKLASWGWECVPGDAATTDDTADLEAAEAAETETESDPQD